MEQVRMETAEDGFKLPDELPRGGIVGAVTLVDCIYGDVPRSRSFLDRLLVRQPPQPVEPGEIYYSFILNDPRPLPFVPYRGQQKFFNVPDDLYGSEFDL